MTPHQVLGVALDATMDELKAAYRKLARECHPDWHPGDAAKAERFKQVAYAYSLLSKPDQRQRCESAVQQAVRDFVVKAGQDVIERAKDEASRYAAQKLSDQGPLGKRAASAADILLDVAKDWGTSKLSNLGKGPP